MLLTEGNQCCPLWPSSTFHKSRHLIHVSKLVLIDITLVKIFSHRVVTPINWRDSCFFSYIHLQISHGIWNEYRSLSWLDLVAHFKVFWSENVSGYSSVTLIGMFVYDSNLYLGILRITMDFTAGLAWSVTKALEQSILWYRYIMV